jgi:uncharacterized protein DUF4440/uncharacterized protein DUF3471
MNEAHVFGRYGEAIISSALTLTFFLFQGFAHAEHSTITLAELQQRTQQLWDAVAPGSKRPWEEMVADDAMILDETGHDMDKNALLATISKLPPGYSGSIQIVDAKVRFAPKVAILSYNANETETVFGAVLHARYHMTDTWLYRNRRWQIVASQVLRYYEDPEAVELKPEQLDEYVGRYQLAPGNVLVITRRGEQLYAERESAKPYPLMAECVDLFFRPGAEGRRLFHRDTEGRVDAMIDRRNNEDLQWKRAD